MTAQEWSDYIGRLDVDDRVMAQSIMDRMVHVLENFRNHALAERQALEREVAALRKQVKALRDQVEANG